jgi:hypothetical protein
MYFCHFDVGVVESYKLYYMEEALHGGGQCLLPSLNHVESCESMLAISVFMHNFGSKCTTTLSLWFVQLDMIKISI